MPVPGSEPVSPAPRPRRASRLRQVTAGLRDFGRHHRALIAIVGSLGTVAVLVFVLAGRREEFSNALSEITAGVFAVTALLQIVALLARSEAWHLTIQAAGGTVARRVLYRASAMQVLGGMINGQLGVAARIVYTERRLRSRRVVCRSAMKLYRDGVPPFSGCRSQRAVAQMRERLTAQRGGQGTVQHGRGVEVNRPGCRRGS